MRLQTQLTLSHLLVTLIAVFIFVGGLLLGYGIYLQTALPARWAADVAESYADYVDALISDDCAGCIQPFIEDEFLPVGEFPEDDEWFIVMADNGTVLASNDPATYPPGSTATLFGIDATDFEPETTTFGNIDDRHFALAPLIDNGGWVYFHAGGFDATGQLRQTVRVTLLASVGIALITLVLAGLAGAFLGRFFGRKLATLGAASAAFAAGDLTQRIPAGGRDEISQLSQQYNQMADTIARQIGELRQLAETNAQLAAEAEGLARLEERNRLARELHDAVKQQLFGLNLTLGSIQPLLDVNPDAARDRLQQVIEQTQDVQVELDQIIKQMRPISLQDRGLLPAVEQLGAQWSTQTEIATTVDGHAARPLPLAIEQAAFRIVQEALQNVAKHAAATRVAIDLDYDARRLHVTITDNGKGFSPADVDGGQSFGLQNMRERAARIGGELHIQSQTGGTRITLAVPLAPNEL